MSTITIEVSEDHLAKLAKPAALLGISPEELAKRSAEKLLAQNDEEFEKILGYLMIKNAELMKRLAR